MMSHLLRSPLRFPPLLIGLLALVLATGLAACDATSPENALGTDEAALSKAAPVASSPGCVMGNQPSGALYEICTPADNPTGTLVVYARGFVMPQLPVTLPRAEAGVAVSDVITGRGFAYAATSYTTNGLVRPADAVRDLRHLVTLYAQQYGKPQRVLLFGISNGALFSTLAMENHKQLFDGAFAACAPVGDYQRQINYLGDVFVLFQHYFPGVVPGSPGEVPGTYIANLAQQAAPLSLTPDRYLAGVVTSALSAPANFGQTLQLLSVIAITPDIGAAYASPQEGIETVIRAVIYNVFAGADAVEKLGGKFYDNTTRQYVGSADDAALNATIARYAADANAAAQVKAHYQTRGRLEAPVVTLHTLRDPTVPFWHTGLYADKLGADAALRTLVPINRYGHCAFTPQEINEGLNTLLARVEAAHMLAI